MPNPTVKQSPQERNRLLDESMQRAYAKVSQEMPDVKRVSVTPSTSNFLTGMMMPRGSMAVTNPFTGNITYNPDAMQGQSQDELEQILAHEMTHTRQTQGMPWYQVIKNKIFNNTNPPATQHGFFDNSYSWDPNEMEAFQTERNRRPNFPDPIYGTRDIVLPPSKMMKK